MNSIALVFGLICTAFWQSPQTPAEAPVQEPVLRVYDLADLVNAQKMASPAPENSSETKQENLAAETQIWGERILQHIPEGLGKDPEIVPMTHNQFVVNANQRQHDWIAAFFQAQRRHPAILLESVFLQGARQALPDHLENGWRMLTAQEIDAYEKRWRESWKGDLLMAPHLLIANGGQAVLETMQSVSVVRDWQFMDTEPGPTTLLIPILEQVEEGLRLDCEVLGLPGGTIHLELEFLHQRLQRPLQVQKRHLRLANGASQTVEQAEPVVLQATLESTFQLPLGQGLLFVTELADQPGQSMAVLVKVLDPAVQAEANTRKGDSKKP
ncbi:MAG: hypothetical protein DWQ01_12370 [Planctomycetota bacterium]|nr:MAG: hypothetical protein DWQ01_12370 [Planctomycetota bacterium]